MALRSQAFKVVGVANSRVLDTGAGYSGKAGLKASEAEPKALLYLLISSDETAGNVILGVIGQTEILQHYDYTLDTYQATGTTEFKSTTKERMIPVNRVLSPSETFYVGINCGATATDIYGSYVYDDEGRLP